MLSGHRLINIAADWLTEHRSAYRAWAASEAGAAQLARAALAGPAPLRSPLIAAFTAEGRRVQDELDVLSARERQLQLEQQQLRAELASSAAREGLLQVEHQRLVAECRQRCAAAEEKVAAMEQTVVAAERVIALLRQRLDQTAAHRRAERHALGAVAAAAQAAELAAAETVGRLRSRAPPTLPPLLAAHLRQTAAGHGSGSRARRVARHLLGWLAKQ